MTGLGLNWPEHADRTPEDERDSGSQFSVNWNRTMRDLRNELRRFGVEEWDLDTVSGSDSDPCVVLRWRDEHGRHAIADDQFVSKEANLRNLYLWLREQRKSSDRGIVTGSEDQLAAAALPSGDESEEGGLTRPAHEVLGLPRDASEAVVQARFKQLVKERHPDRGGSDEAFRELKAAREALLDETAEAGTP